MKKYIIYSFVLSFIAMATNGVSHSSGLSYGEGIKFEEKYMMDDIVKTLQEKNIPYIINDEGFITYPTKYKDTVDGIIDALKEKPVMYFKSKKYADKLQRVLEDEKISYEVRNGIGGEIHIFWKKENDEKVRKLIRIHFDQSP